MTALARPMAPQEIGAIKKSHNLSERRYYSELPPSIYLLLKDRSLFFRISYAVFKR
jgi:hypothetical protein